MKRAIEQLTRSLRLAVGRAVLTLVDDAQKMQAVQLEGLPGEVLDGVERMQDYGMSSHPPKGAEAILVALGGQRQHSVVIAAEDRRHRVTGLQEGEVCLYTMEDDDDGAHRMTLKQGRILDIEVDELRITTGASSVVMNNAGTTWTTPRFDRNTP